MRTRLDGGGGGAGRARGAQRAGRSGRAAVVTAAAVSILAGGATAGIVRLDAPGSWISATADASDFRYRVSNTNWDLMAASSTQISNSTIASSRNAGNHTALNHAAWNFALEFTPGSGYVFSLAPVAGQNSLAAQSVSWTTPVGSGGVGGSSVTPLRAHNAIKLVVSAGSGMPSGIDTAYVDVRDLSFYAAGFGTVGSLSAMRDTWDDTGSLTDRDDPDTLTQWVLAEGDLSGTPWALRGRVQAGFTYVAGQTSPGGNLDERLKFDVMPMWVTAIPAPGAVALGGLAAVVLARRVRPRGDGGDEGEAGYARDYADGAAASRTKRSRASTT
jgi:hypothetical protein